MPYSKSILILLLLASTAVQASPNLSFDTEKIGRVFATEDGSLCLNNPEGVLGLLVQENGQLETIFDRTLRQSRRQARLGRQALKKARLAGKSRRALDKYRARFQTARSRANWLRSSARSCRQAEQSGSLPSMPGMRPDQDNKEDGFLRGSLACRVDINGDGAVNSLDISALLTLYMAGDPMADWNGDGYLNSTDIAAFLADWLLVVEGGLECIQEGPAPENNECENVHELDFSGEVSLGCSGPNQQHTRTSYEYSLFDLSADSRIIYVSSSEGDDANSGLTPLAPKRTIAAGYNLLRNGYPDWLLLKRGDVFENQWLGNADGWRKSGRSSSERMLAGSYGAFSAPRPVLRTGSSDGVRIAGSQSVHPVNLIFSGLEFTANHRNPNDPSFNPGSVSSLPSGLGYERVGRNLLVEDCEFSYYGLGMLIQPPNQVDYVYDIELRRNIIRDSYATSAHSQGIFATRVNGLFIEENVWDHNGWNEQILEAPATIFNRNLYLSQNTNVVARGNIDANGASGGMQIRAGGLAERNLYLNNPVSLGMGHPQNHSGTITSGIMRYNVVLGARDVNGIGHGWGLAVGTRVNGMQIYENIISKNQLGTGNVYGLMLNADERELSQNIQISNNIVYKWDHSGTGTALMFRREPILSNVSISNNKLVQPNGATLVDTGATNLSGVTFSSNTYFTSHASRWFRVGSSFLNFSNWLSTIGEQAASNLEPSFPDPDRDISSYMLTQNKTPSLEGFLSEARRQSRNNWRRAYSSEDVINYIREGFGVHPLP